MQQPSSLIFLAIVVIWAGYLLQHWIRRREALATARSVDQFSDAMRVLDRRDHKVEIATQQTSEAPHASRPSAPRAEESAPRPSLRAGTIMTGETQQPRRDHPVEQPVEAVETASTAHRLAGLAATAGSPKLRAIALTLSFAVLLITIVCAPFGALPWWSPILMLAVTGGVFAWCRASAMAASAHRTPVRATRPVAPSSAKGRAGVQLPKRKPQPVAAPVPVLTKATMPEPVAQPSVARAEQVYDVSAASAPALRPVAPVAPVAQAAPVVAQTDDAAWEPVAVPPPTYTMKERAPERPEPVPAATSAKTYEHVANEDLPFDGLALDQDLDDLPSVFRAG